MRNAPKFGKRISKVALNSAAKLEAATATVREWMGEHADASTVKRLASDIAKRA